MNHDVIIKINEPVDDIKFSKLLQGLAKIDGFDFNVDAIIEIKNQEF